MNTGTVGLNIGKRSIEAIRLVDGEKPERFRSSTNGGGLIALIEWLRKMIKTGGLYRYGDDDLLNRKLVQYGLV